MAANNEEVFIELINRSMIPSTGCTEPIAIALNTAIARKEAKGSFKRLVLTVDPYLYKNAKGVGIPGANERGVPLAAALGITAGNADAKMNVLANVSQYALDSAKNLLNQIEIRIRSDISTLFIQSEFYTDVDCVRVITLKEHNNIVDISHAPINDYCFKEATGENLLIKKYCLQDFLVFVNNVLLSRIEFLNDALQMNLNISHSGEVIGLGSHFNHLIESGLVKRSLPFEAKYLAGSGAYARMSGVSLPVMTVTGSGNQGIVLFIPVEVVAKELNSPYDKKIRALALASLINILGKSYLGSLSAICPCGISSGLGASLGICYLLDASESQMIGAARNMIGSVTGMICDGGKEGCAHKVALSAELAVYSALLSLSGTSISYEDGILAKTLNEMFSNVKYLLDKGMPNANNAILEIMVNSKLK